MSTLSGLTTTATVKQETDSVGGFILDSDAYLMQIELAYMNKSKGGATSLTVHLKSADGKKLKNTLWVTSGDKKGNKITYTDRNKNEVHLPGYVIANHICLLTVGKEIHQLSTETKKINLYDFDLGKEVLTDVECITEIMGKTIIAGVIKQTVDKNVKDASDNYVPSGETRDENEIDKVFSAADKRTVVEIRAEATEPAFLEKWTDKWKGVSKNKSKASGAQKGAPAGNVNAAPQTSLFNS